MKKIKLADILALSPLAIILLNNIFPGHFESVLSYGLIILAGICCVVLYHTGMKAAGICSLPALICIIAGFDGAHDYIRYGAGTVGELADKFCYFICGIWCLYFLVKNSPNKE